MIAAAIKYNCKNHCLSQGPICLIIVNFIGDFAHKREI